MKKTLIILAILLVLYSVYSLLKVLNTKTKTSIVTTLKDYRTEDWGGPKKPFNLLKDVEEFVGCDAVQIIRQETFVFGTLKSQELKIRHLLMEDDDHPFW